MAAKRSTLVKTEHALLFAVKHSKHIAATKDIVSASCLFHVHFGREAKLCSKRTSSVSAMYFSKSFHVGMYSGHVVTQHFERWKEYSELTCDKKTSFSALAVDRNTIKSHLIVSQVPVNLFVDKCMFDNIIEDVLFRHDDDSDEVLNERAL